MPPTSTLLFLSVPAKTFLGLDLISFNTSQTFHGITSIQPGLHFLYSGTDASLSIRHGLWLNLTNDTHIFQWSPEHETIIQLAPSNPAVQAALATLPSLRARGGLVDHSALQDASHDSQHASSGPVSSDDEASWPQLTSHISLKTLTRIFGVSHAVSSVSSAPQDSDAEHIPGLSASEASSALHGDEETPMNLLPINLKRTWPTEAVGRERTVAARDRSWYLGHLMDRTVPPPHGREKAAGEVAGEMQVCFLLVLLLGNYSALEGWKRILGVLLTCRVAVGEIGGFFEEVLRVLREQLGRCEDVEGGLFEFGAGEGSGNWLRALLRGFKGVVEEVGDSGLKGEISQIEDLMRERYGWEVDSAVLRRGIVELEDGERAELTMEGADEEDEMGEYAPVFVET